MCPAGGAAGPPGRGGVESVGTAGGGGHRNGVRRWCGGDGSWQASCPAVLVARKASRRSGRSSTMSGGPACRAAGRPRPAPRNGRHGWPSLRTRSERPQPAEAAPVRRSPPIAGARTPCAPLPSTHPPTQRQPVDDRASSGPMCERGARPRSREDGPLRALPAIHFIRAGQAREHGARPRKAMVRHRGLGLDIVLRAHRSSGPSLAASEVPESAKSPGTPAWPAQDRRGADPGRSRPAGAPGRRPSSCPRWSLPSVAREIPRSDAEGPSVAETAGRHGHRDARSGKFDGIVPHRDVREPPRSPDSPDSVTSAGSATRGAFPRHFYGAPSLPLREFASYFGHSFAGWDPAHAGVPAATPVDGPPSTAFAGTTPGTTHASLGRRPCRTIATTRSSSTPAAASGRAPDPTSTPSAWPGNTAEERGSRFRQRRARAGRHRASGSRTQRSAARRSFTVTVVGSHCRRPREPK